MKKIIINESQLNKIVLNEYLDKSYGIPLYRYLTMSDDKEKELLFGWGVDNELVTEYYLNDNYGYEDLEMLTSYEFDESEYEGYDEDDIEEFRNEKMNEILDTISSDPYRFYNNLKQHYNEFNNLYWHLYGKATSLEYCYEAPAFLFFSRPHVIKNKWLVHFSDNAYHIAKDGFMYGTQDLDRLAYSGCGDIHNKYGKGYDFAYEAESASDVFQCLDRHFDTPKYGSEMVLFMASGVEVWHDGDEERQVIFYGPSAKNIIYIRKEIANGSEYYGDSEVWQVCDVHNNRVLYETSDLDEVISWAINNYAQYRRRIVSFNKDKEFDNNTNL